MMDGAFATTCEPDECLIDEIDVPEPGEWPLKYILDLRTARSRPKPSWLVDGMIPAKKVVLPWGGTGEGKTYWTTEIVTAVVMRRPAFGRFPVVAEGAPGIAVMFVGEDHDEYVFSRLSAIESYNECELQGKVFVVENAIPLHKQGLRKSYVDELHRLQDITGKHIEIIGNDTLKRSLGSLSQNDDDTAREFTDMMEGLSEEFGATILCNSHQPKSGAARGIAGAGDFMDCGPVTPHLIGRKHPKTQQLLGVKCVFEPKFRIGPTPPSFYAECVTVPLLEPYNGHTSDLVLVSDSRGDEAPEPAEGPTQFQIWHDLLTQLGRRDWEHGLTDRQWAAELVKRGFGEGDDEKTLEMVKNRHRTKNMKALYAKKKPLEGGREEVRWFCPP
jgi:hypothetical protein